MYTFASHPPHAVAVDLANDTELKIRERGSIY